MKISFSKKQIIGVTSVVTMLVLWKLLAVFFKSEYIMPHPESTIATVFRLFFDKEFLSVVGTTIVRGLAGFILSGVLGLAIGVLAGINPGFNAFINPILITIRSTPIIALILLALIWFSPNTVPVFIAMLTMFPFICTNVVDGIRSVEPGLVEMARFYKVRTRRIVSGVYIPAIMPFIISGASSALGIGWRAIIIGEVLSQPQFGIGTQMHTAQTFLKVDEVIAWTLIAVLISYIFEKAIRWSERKIVTWKV